MENEISEVKIYEFTPFLFAGFIYYECQQFVKTTADNLAVIVIAILSGYSYYRVKKMIKIKNDFLRSLCAFLIIFCLAGFLTGFLTASL